MCSLWGTWIGAAREKCVMNPVKSSEEICSRRKTIGAELRKAADTHENLWETIRETPRIISSVNDSGLMASFKCSLKRFPGQHHLWVNSLSRCCLWLQFTSGHLMESITVLFHWNVSTSLKLVLTCCLFLHVVPSLAHLCAFGDLSGVPLRPVSKRCLRMCLLPSVYSEHFWMSAGRRWASWNRNICGSLVFDHHWLHADKQSHRSLVFFKHVCFWK